MARRTGGKGSAIRVRHPAAAALIVLAVLVGGLVLGFRVARSGAVPGTQLAGIEVGGMGDAELAAAVSEYAKRRQDLPVRVRRGDAEVTTTAQAIGYELQQLETVQAVLARGRQLNPVTALADHIRATVGAPLSVEPVAQVDTEQLRTWVEQEAAPKLAQEPVQATLKFDGASFQRVSAEPGAKIVTDQLADALRSALLDHSPGQGGAEGVVVTAEAKSVEPKTTAADLDAVAAAAKQALSAPVTLTRGDTSITLQPADIGALLDVTRTDRDTDGKRLALTVNPDKLVKRLSGQGVEREPVDAEFVVQGGAVRITESVDGFRVQPQKAAEQVLDLATSSGSRTAELEGEVIEPDLTTAEARGLGITERVSTFTTHFTPGEPRVTNIQRMAETVDGALIRPGETFSLNGHVGRRTRAKGYVADGAILGGEFVQEVGGGVSQFATTLYNAAYFGGYAIPDFKAHSYYFSRYPVGRESTLNYPNIDVKVRNNSPHGALITTSASASSVTVSIWGTEWVEVDSIEGERKNVQEPKVKLRENPDLAPGERRVIHPGKTGFEITVTRVLRFPDGRVERQPEFTRYQSKPRVVEVGPAPDKPESGGEQAADGSSSAGGGEDTADSQDAAGSQG